MTFGDQQASADITIPLSAISMPLPLSSAGLPYFQAQLTDPANNAHVFDTAYVYLVNNDQQPVAVNDTYYTLENQTLNAGWCNYQPSLLENDYDWAFDDLTVVAVNGQNFIPDAPVGLASGAQLVIDNDGNFSYTPPSNLGRGGFIQLHH